MSSLNNIINNLDWTILLRIVAVLLCITFHELSHGLVAYKLGDPTAKNMGRLTLNPIKHIDLIGMLMLIVVGFGWAKPVSVDMRHFKNPKRGMALTALAGPVSNIILSYVALLIRAAILPFDNNAYVDAVVYLLELIAILSVGLALFNIIPIPPLDWSKVLFSFLSDKMYYKLMRYERYGFILLIIVLYSGIMGNWLTNSIYAIVNFLAEYSFFPYDIVMSLIS